MAAHAVLTAYFLGTFRVSIDGVPVDTASSRRTRNMLAYLVAHRRPPVPRDVLMDVFWPTAHPDAARNSLHVALSGVRQVLRAAYPHPVIERRFGAYQLVPLIGVWTDLEQFEVACRSGRRADRAGDERAAAREYEAACQLYDGDFLADDPYAEWACPVRERLRLDAVDIQSRLVEIYIARGDHGPAALLARRILAIDPCNERVHCSLMTCYAATGLRHLALAQYVRLATALRDTFQVRPSAETSALYQSLRQPVGAGVGSG
ncbi:MAG TPA: BTAD domain-containing putative transcriptional regulator [Micromonosporaceae bacterium]|jgi:DNA-binding SARP family transcriptional activator